MGFPNPFHQVVHGLFPKGNVQVSFSSDDQQARSESDIVINPTNPLNMVGASKRFIVPDKYVFTLTTYHTFDGGNTWQEVALPLEPGWMGFTDPSLAFNAEGECFIIVEPMFWPDFANKPEIINSFGMRVFQSNNGGVSWLPPVTLSTGAGDDKQWMTCDDRSESPFLGNLYAVFGVGDMGFSQSTDGGSTWHGLGNTPTPTYMKPEVFAPAITTDSKGWVHVFNIPQHGYGDGGLNYWRSKDGGKTFEAAKDIAPGLVSLDGFVNNTGWALFPGGNFRNSTMVTACTAQDQTIVVAWPDMRDKFSRIFYMISFDGGDNWSGSDTNGLNMMPDQDWGEFQCFMPQLTATESGKIGCAFYVFGKDADSGKMLIDVFLAASYDNGGEFAYLTRVTEQGWDPLIKPPFARGNPKLHFIGDYFGLAGTDDFFIPFWTDTRTGRQEIWCDIVKTSYGKDKTPSWEAVYVSLGVMVDGGGFIIIGGKLVRIPPRSPMVKVLESLALVEESRSLDERSGSEVLRVGLNALDESLGNMKAELGF